MNATVKEWIDKAEGDYATAGREMQATISPNDDAVCYHAQQCIGKLMKRHEGFFFVFLRDLRGQTYFQGSSSFAVSAPAVG